MRRVPLCKLFLITILSLTIFIVYFLVFHLNNHNRFVNNSESVVSNKIPTIENKKKTVDKFVVSFVCCESRFNESLNVVKSVLLFTSRPVLFIIFADDNLRPKFNYTLKIWRTSTKNRFDFELHKISFPKEHEEEWLNLFSKCAAQRLFIPKLLPHIDSMIYVDTDTLFLGPVEELWAHFNMFNSSQISAMTLEDDNPSVSWYPRFAKHPFYGNFGLNSGVMLMNLTRMRHFGWTDYVTPLMLKWKLYIPWGDQDIINIIFHYHEEAVYVLECRFNFRTEQCMYGDACAAAGARGVFLLHASRRAFHNNKQPAFQAIYRAIDEYKIGVDEPLSFLSSMQKYLIEAPSSNCGNLKHYFLRIPKRVVGVSENDYAGNS